MVPALEITGLPTPERHKEDLTAGLAHGRANSPQIAVQPHLASDFFDARPQLAAVREKVVIGIDGPVAAYRWCLSPVIPPGCPNRRLRQASRLKHHAMEGFCTNSTAGGSAYQYRGSRNP